MEWLTNLLDRYFERVLGPQFKASPKEPIKANEAGRLLWSVFERVREHTPLIEAAGYQTKYEQKADELVLELADRNGFSSWESAPIGVWSVLHARLTWSVSVVAIASLRTNPVMLRLPRDLGHPERTQAAAIYFLLGPGRTVPKGMRGKSLDGTLPEFLAASPPRL